MKDYTQAIVYAYRVIDFFYEQIPTDKQIFCKRGFNRLVAVDDDVFSACIAAERYHAVYYQDGYHPKVDVIGGFGLMSGKINPKLNGKRLSEAQMLKYVLMRLGVKEDDIEICCDKGTNTGQNLSAYVEELKGIGAEKQTLLFCLTKRLAGRFYLTQVKQQGQLQAYYYSMGPQFYPCDFSNLSGGIKKELRLYNGKSLAGGLPFFSEAASIYDRYLRYTKPNKKGEAFMAELEKPLPDEIKEAGEYLCRRFKLKLPEFSWLKLWQYIKTYGSYLNRRVYFESDFEWIMNFWQIGLKSMIYGEFNSHLDRVEKFDELWQRKTTWLEFPPRKGCW